MLINCFQEVPIRHGEQSQAVRRHVWHHLSTGHLCPLRTSCPACVLLSVLAAVLPRRLPSLMAPAAEKKRHADIYAEHHAPSRRDN